MNDCRVFLYGPTVERRNFNWPAGAPMPAVGDEVYLAPTSITWRFRVLKRSLGIDQHPGGSHVGLVTAVHIHVDTDPPPGFPD